MSGTTDAAAAVNLVMADLPVTINAIGRRSQGGGSGRGIARARYDPDPASDWRSAVPIGNNIRIMSAGAAMRPIRDCCFSAADR